MWHTSSILVKEKRHDGHSGISSLRSSWASTANNKQRCGRAGRVQEGLCLHLFVFERSKKLRAFQLPEMKRVPLEDLCLTIHHLGLGRAAPVLAEALESPSRESVEAALHMLVGLGALDSNEQLTELGKTLAELPLEPRVGKMLVIGRALGVLEPCLTIAASSQSRDPFLRPLHAREAADAARLKLGEGTRSDHLTLVNAYEGWEAAKTAGKESTWCQDNFVSWRTMQTIARARQQLHSVLIRCNLGGDGNFMWRCRKDVATSLLRAVIVNSFWPQLALFAGVEKTMSREGKWGTRLVLHGRDNWGLKCHPSSIVAGLSEAQVGNATFACYESKLLTSDLFLTNLTLVSPLTSFLFGTEPVCYEAPHSPLSALIPGGSSSVGLVQENWIAATADKAVANMLRRIRSAVSKFVEDHIVDRVSDPVSRQQCEDFAECLAEILQGLPTRGGSEWKSSRNKIPPPQLPVLPQSSSVLLPTPSPYLGPGRGVNGAGFRLEEKERPSQARPTSPRRSPPSKRHASRSRSPSRRASPSRSPSRSRHRRRRSRSRRASRSESRSRKRRKNRSRSRSRKPRSRGSRARDRTRKSRSSERRHRSRSKHRSPSKLRDQSRHRDKKDAHRRSHSRHKKSKHRKEKE